MAYVALVLVIILNFVDFVVTTLVIQHLGFEAEANPILRHAMDAAQSIWPMFAAKVFNTGFALFAFHVAKDEPRALVAYTWLLWAVSAILAVAIGLGVLILIGV